MESRARLMLGVFVFYAFLACIASNVLAQGPVMEGISERFASLKADYAEKEAELKTATAELGRIPKDERTLNELEKIKDRIFTIRREMANLDEDIKDLRLRIKSPVLNLEGAVNKLSTGYTINNNEGKPARSVMFTELPGRIVPGKPFETAIEIRSLVDAADATFAWEYNYVKASINVGPVKVHLKKLTAECGRSAYGAINVRLKFMPTRIVFKELITEYYYSVKIETKALIEGSETGLSEPLFTWFYWLKPSDDNLYDTETADKYRGNRGIIDWSVLKGNLHDNHITINDGTNTANFVLRPFKKGERFFPGALPGYEHPGQLASRPSNCKDRMDESVRIPDLVGLHSGVAEEHLERLGLNHSQSPAGAATDPSDVGKVAGQDPPAGHFIEKNKTITLRVYSEHIIRKVVPNVEGKKLDKALEALKNAGLEAEPRIKKSAESKQQELTVISQKPAAGVEVKPEQKIKLTIYGKHKPLLVPRLVGKKFNQAKEILAKMKLVADPRIKKVATSKSQELTVISQKPVAGMDVKPDQKVRLFIYGKYREKAPEEKVADLDCRRFGKARAYWDSGAQKAKCGCLSGYQWKGNTCTASRETQIRNYDCSMKQYSYTKWDDSVNAPRCFCKSGYTWNNNYSHCVRVVVTKKKASCRQGQVWDRGSNRCIKKSGGGQKKKCSTKIWQIQIFMGQYKATNKIELKQYAEGYARDARSLGCNQSEINSALGTGGSSIDGSYTGSCKWESGVGSNAFGTGAGGGWDCTCKVVNGLCGGKPYPGPAGISQCKSDSLGWHSRSRSDTRSMERENLPPGQTSCACLNASTGKYIILKRSICSDRWGEPR